MFYAVAWLDRTSEIGALTAAIAWRQTSTVDCLNAAAAAGCLDDDDDDDIGAVGNGPSAADVPWHAYLPAAFSVVHFAMAVSTVRPIRDGAWPAAVTMVAAAASCAPVAAHGTAAALLVVATGGMRVINCRITRLLLLLLLRRPSPAHRDDGRLTVTVGRLARRHWRTTELVTGSVCRAYGVDLMVAFLLAAVRVTYVAVAVFHRLDADADAEQSARTTMSLAVVVQLVAWFGQFAYLAYTCDGLTAQVCTTETGVGGRVSN